MLTQSLKIYRVNPDYYIFKDCTSNKSRLKNILRVLNKKRPKSERLTIDQLSSFEEAGHKYYLFVHKHKEKKSDWANYFPSSLTASWDLSLQNLSLILFIDNDIDIFLVIGGKAFQQVVKFIDHTFGLRLLSKIIVPSEDQILSINTRGLTGTRSGISEQYREEIRVADFAKFGKLPTEAHLTLSKKVTDEFFSFLKNKESERIRIHVGKSFKVKKNLTFEELKQLIVEIGHIMSLAEQEYLSSYIQESNPKLIVENFRPLLIGKIFNDFTNKKILGTNYVQTFEFDFCNSKVLEFYSADKYVLSEKKGKGYTTFDETNFKDEIYDRVLNQAIKNLPGETELFDFMVYIQGVRVLGYQDGDKTCSASFLYHFTAEFDYRSDTIFLVDNRWYRIKRLFLEELRTETLSLLKRSKLPSKIFDFPYADGRTEYQYNLQYHGHQGYYVFDTITPHGIELCDVLFVGTDATYLIHVKKGFNNSIRELTNQITLGARRLHTDLRSSGKSYLKKIWESYLKKYAIQDDLDFANFLEIFDKKIVFVLAFISQFKDNASIIDQLERYGSNIAKYSMIECSFDLQDYKYELNVHQIPKQSPGIKSL